MRVLLVDDDPDYRMMLGMQLEIQHRIDVAGEASDGHEALGFLRQEATPDAVILDLMMPGMDGFETIGHLIRDHPGLPVVAYTAVASNGVREHCQTHGIPLLRKSGDTTALVDQLRTMVG